MVSSDPFVSVIINNYNYGQFVREAIESALRQTYQRKEIIVVDDGSTDNSRDVIADFGQKVIPILKANEGQASTFNVGFEESRGDIVVFLDADDFLLPEAVDRAVRLLRNSNAVKVHWPLWEVDTQGRMIGQVHTKNLIEGNFRDVCIRSGPISLSQSPTSGNAWSRWFLREVMPLPEHDDKHGADGFLKKLCPIFGEIRRLENPYGCYRIHADNYGGGRTEMFKLRRGLSRYSTYCKLLAHHLARMGVTVDRCAWMGPDTQFAWLTKAVALEDDLARLIPQNNRVILIDDNAFGTDLLPSCDVHPFIESNGQYWGAPNDDLHAMKEYEKAKALGPSFLAFAFPSFWWIDQYPEFIRRVRTDAECICANERLMLFDFARRAHADKTADVQSDNVRCSGHG